ncbi:recombinase family protein [Lysobacter sp. ESA13C]|uniref:recombinase family protein n=1 Tax=Lysobacter sp. ESA13C TaxID=2862676 RepID=UPI001CC040AA|nr:recombinase family protein [Lysobacter sp. ESA13C]
MNAQATATNAHQPITRCAIYARKSTRKGLEREYNTIEAQRDAALAYIASQRGRGWVPIATVYDDPGWSAATMIRPGLQRLMADVRAGLVDVIVAYKIDRISRSIRDFQELLKVLEEKEVAFVSVTQSFNTADTVGRLTVNILMSFAEYDRDLDVERAIDKMLASKAKGLWMHGIPPLGYGIKDRRLAINHLEAAQVRFIFQRLIETESILAVVRDAAGMGYKSKAWTTRAGRVRTPQPHDKSTIHKILHNRTYLGELKHRDQYFTDCHPPIIDRAVWEKVQTILASNAAARGNASRAKVPFLLKGLIIGPDRRAMTPYHTVKSNGRLYRYYISTAQIHEGTTAARFPRLPAAELEGIVVGYVRQMLNTPEMLSAIVAQAAASEAGLDEAMIVVGIRQFDQVWDALFPAEQKRLLRLLIEQVVVNLDGMEIRFHPNGVSSLVDELGREGIAA